MKPEDQSGRAKVNDDEQSLAQRKQNMNDLWHRQLRKSEAMEERSEDIKRARGIFRMLREKAESKYNNFADAYGSVFQLDEKGAINFASFYKALQGLYFDRFVTMQQARSIFDLADPDASGTIDYNELQRMYNFAELKLGRPVKDAAGQGGPGV